MNTVTATLANLTPAALATGKDFDVDTVLTLEGRYNAARDAAQALPLVSPIYEYTATVPGVTGVLVGLKRVTTTLSGFTPASVGAGVSFDVSAEAIGSARFLGVPPETMEADVALLTEASVYPSSEDRADGQNVIDTERKRFSDLPGGYTLGGNLAFEMEAVTPAEMPVVFDIVLTPIPVSNPVTLDPVGPDGISVQIDVDVEAITADETGYDNLMVVGVEQGTAMGNSRVWPVAAGHSPIRASEVISD